MPTITSDLRPVLLGLLCSAVAACSSGGKGANLPLTTPPVKAATPVGLGGTANHARSAKHYAGSLDPTDIQQRFFGAGPTDIFFILATLDGRINDVNSITASGSHACVSQEPVAYTLTPPGQTITFYAQCAQTLSGMGASGIMQFGQKDGVTYIYAEVGAGIVAAKLTPLTDGSDADGGSGLTLADAGPGVDGGAPIIAGQFSVEAWLSVGLTNATGCGNMSGFDDCSYGNIHLLANSLDQTIEMEAAGLGMGYCGAQLASDGANVYFTGSVDMGTTCNATASTCASAADISTTGNCGASVTTFALAPYGREAGSGPNGPFGASLYPSLGGDDVVLNGTSTDSVTFGPMTIPAGVGSL